MAERRPPVEPITTYMERSLEAEGATARGVGYRSRERQQVAFAQVLRILGSDPEPFTVNDLGCGLADLYSFLKAQGLPVEFYRGYDVAEKMLDAARQRVGSDAELVRSSRLTHDADYSFACGIFNVNFEEDEGVWLDYMKSVVRDLFDHSTKGCAFNSLTTYVDWRDPSQFYVDPVDLFSFCIDELSPRVALLHDYPLYEWTMLVRREHE
jgi:hypothetical protein